MKAAEECAGTLANVIPPEQSIRILNPLILSSEYPVILAAIKMQNKVSFHIWNSAVILFEKVLQFISVTKHSIKQNTFLYMNKGLLELNINASIKTFH